MTWQNREKAIIMISSEMAELLGMSDRVCVMCNGRLTGEITEKEEMSRQMLCSLQHNSDAEGG